MPQQIQKSICRLELGKFAFLFAACKYWYFIGWISKLCVFTATHPVVENSSHNFVSQHTSCVRFSTFWIRSGRARFDSCQGMDFFLRHYVQTRPITNVASYPKCTEKSDCHSCISQFVFRQVHSLFQSKFSKKCHQVLPRVNSGFRREVHENCAFPDYYAAISGNFLPTSEENLSFPSSKGKMVLIVCPETSVRN